MSIHIVTDLSYGDSGKGTTVDYLTRRLEGNTVVVRHNGGPQAAHNVVTDYGLHHTFSQFGAGTFAGAKTFLSRFMLINPLNMMREADVLATKGYPSIWTRTFVDENCMLITPWHVVINRLQEQRRGISRHGSCGKGIGVCMKQSIDMSGLTVRVKDIADGGFWPRLEALRMYLAKTYKQYEGDSPEWQTIEDVDLSAYIVERFRDWLKLVNVVPSERLAAMVNEHENVIFEGAQGVLLDEWFGFHPYTTWSTCTHENALTLLSEINHPHDVTRLGVIRAVTTRHGAGPHPTEDVYMSERWNEPHNGTGAYQGVFRVGHLDLVAHRYAAKVCGGVDGVVVTHLDMNDRWLYCDRYDQMADVPMGVKGDLELQERITNQMRNAEPILSFAGVDGESELLDAIERNIAPISILSYGPTAHNKHMLYDDSVSKHRSTTAAH